MPINWYSKKQATVVMATYGSKFIAAHMCVDQIVDLRLTLCYLSVPIREKSYMLGNSSSSKPHAKLHKRDNALSSHSVHEAVASRFVNFTYLDGKYNPADIMSKHWAYQQIWIMLKPIFFFHRDTAEIYEDA